MSRAVLILCFSVCCFSSIAQYKYDNVLYKTIYIQNICRELDDYPGGLLLDVRSPGEYADTSSNGLNIGRFKNAVNIDVGDLGKRIGEISAYKDKPVFVYCSHSQRSRRASKMLADSGFLKVYNINEGMTGIRQMPAGPNQCLYNRLQTNNTYDIISATDLCSKISVSAKDIFLLDVRADSAFNHISTDARTNSFGVFKNSTHIPLAILEANLSKIPTGKEIIIIDLFGNDASSAALIFKKYNYPGVSVLLEGINRLLATDKKELACLSGSYISNLPYKIINAQELKSFVKTTKDYLFLDVRTVEEFTNTHKNWWQNIGHLQNAVSIPAGQLEDQWQKISAYKTSPVIIYVFSNGTAAHEAATKLVNKGFTNIMVLQGGIFNIGWTAANIQGFSSLAKLREDIPLENQ
jgi:rhodanese-related sulfurtransferase